KVSQPETCPKIDGDRQRHQRPRAALRRRLRARPPTPCVGTLPLGCLSSNYIIDRSRSVILHIYDDRGMDVAAGHPSALRPLYEKFNCWLLDHDREKMDLIFG
ncbi:DUF3885 domain-containing protein, partial [Paracoccus shanxieyensis]